MMFWGQDLVQDVQRSPTDCLFPKTRVYRQLFGGPGCLSFPEYILAAQGEGRSANQEQGM